MTVNHLAPLADEITGSCGNFGNCGSGFLVEKGGERFSAYAKAKGHFDNGGSRKNL